MEDVRDHPRQHQWLADTVEKFALVFQPMLVKTAATLTNARPRVVAPGRGVLDLSKVQDVSARLKWNPDQNRTEAEKAAYAALGISTTRVNKGEYHLWSCPQLSSSCTVHIRRGPNGMWEVRVNGSDWRPVCMGMNKANVCLVYAVGGTSRVHELLR